MWQTLVWPGERLGEAVEAIARRKKLVSQSPAQNVTLSYEDPLGHRIASDEERLTRWLDAVAAQWGLEIEPVQTSYADVSAFICGAGPALLRLPAQLSPDESFIVLLRGGRWRSALLTPNLAVHRVSSQSLRDALCLEVEAPHVVSINQFLVELGTTAHRRDQARQAILTAQLGPASVPVGRLIRLAPNAPLRHQMRDALLPRAAAVFVLGSLGQLGLTLAAWWLIGQSVLSGQYHTTWLLCWVLLVITAIAVQGFAIAARDDLAIGTGALFKIRFLNGILRLDPEEVRHQGAGQFLGRVLESEAFERLALGGGLTAILSIMQLALATGILALGAGGWPHACLLLFWTAVTIGMAWRHLPRSEAWADAYRSMTNDLVERLLGHRTRLAQEDRMHWHEEEDLLLDHYMQRSQDLDRLGVYFQALIPRGWALLGLLGIVVALFASPYSTAQLAVSLGGLLLALQALMQLTVSLQNLVAAATAWGQTQPLFQASQGPDEHVHRLHLVDDQPLVDDHPSGDIETPVVTARDVSFRYHDQDRQILRRCHLTIRPGDRVLLEGPSGGGKSTLAALLAGQQSPSSGLLLLKGYDRASLGSAEWRRRVVMAPQFHENHVIASSFAFNLLMGRGWPPRPGDLSDAEAICRELGLGDLLDRMPSGLQQVIGESGWQLSHGERSLLYMARALLQKADVLIFDESFGTLDPETLRHALGCVLRRAPALLVIAHP